MTDKRARKLEVQSLHGSHGRISGRQKRGSQCALPGEISSFAIKLAPSKGGGDETGEVSRDHSRPPRAPKDRTDRQGAETSCSMRDGEPEKMEISEAGVRGSGRKPQRAQISGSNSPGTEDLTEPRKPDLIEMMLERGTCSEPCRRWNATRVPPEWMA